MSKENMNKSIDEMIDELFAEPVEKSLDVAAQAQTTADSAVKAAPKAQSDDARGAGRPAQISDVPDKDEDGKREGEYDASIAEKAKASDQPEAGQVAAPASITKSISEAEYAEFMELRKARASKEQEEALAKAREEQKTLIKSAIKEATSSISKENEELRKSLAETQELVKAMAERPQRRKSIDGVQAVEKSFSQEPSGPEKMSKAELLDVAMELALKKSSPFKDEHLIELENTGFVYDPSARGALETYVKNKK